MWKSEVVSKEREKKCKKNQSLIKANGRGTNENTNVFMSRQKNKTNMFVKLKWTPKHKNTVENIWEFHTYRQHYYAFPPVAIFAHNYRETRL